MKKIAFASSVVIGALCTFFACSSNNEGVVVVAIQTDVAVDGDLDAVGIGVSVDGDVKFAGLYGLAKNNGTQVLPATLAIVEPSKQGTSVTIRAIGFRGSNARVIRDVVTTIPHDTVVTLRVPLQFLSLDDGVTGTLNPNQRASEQTASVRTSIHLDDDSSSGDFNPFTGFDSNCSLTNLQTRVDGTCVDAHLDSSKFLPYDSTAIYGPGGAGSAQQCFDMQGCCGSATATVLDKTTCTFPATGDTSRMNVAMRTGGSEGFCITSGCLVPIDLDPVHGFSIDAQNVVHLQPGVCANANVVDVMADYSGSCASKPLTEQIDGAGANCQEDGDGTDGGVTTDGNPNTSDAADGAEGSAAGFLYNNSDLVTFGRDPTTSYFIAVSCNAAGNLSVFSLNLPDLTPVKSGQLTVGNQINAGSLALDGTNYSVVPFPAAATAYAGTYVPSTTIGGPFVVAAGSTLLGNYGDGTYMYYASTLAMGLIYTGQVTASTTASQIGLNGGGSTEYSLTFASNGNGLYGAVTNGAGTSVFVSYPPSPTTTTAPYVTYTNSQGTARSTVVLTDGSGITHAVSLLSQKDNVSASIYDFNTSSNTGAVVVATTNAGNDIASATQPFNLTSDDVGNVYYATSSGDIYVLNISAADGDSTPKVIANVPGVRTLAYFFPNLYYSVPKGGIGQLKTP